MLWSLSVVEVDISTTLNDQKYPNHLGDCYICLDLRLKQRIFWVADSIFAVFCQRGGLTGINADVRSPVGFWWYAGQVGYSEKAIGYLWILKNF